MTGAVTGASSCAVTCAVVMPNASASSCKDFCINKLSLPSTCAVTCAVIAASNRNVVGGLSIMLSRRSIIGRF